MLNGNIASGPIIQAAGEVLPFADASFDAVSEFATLHHAANPTAAQKAPPGLIAGSLTSYNY